MNHLGIADSKVSTDNKPSTPPDQVAGPTTIGTKSRSVVGTITASSSIVAGPFQRAANPESGARLVQPSGLPNG